jgi:hypothetical protein
VRSGNNQFLGSVTQDQDNCDSDITEDLAQML